MLLAVVPSTARSKKYTAIFDDGTRVHFGGAGCMDYTLYYARDPALARRKRQEYIKRHGSGRENWRNPKSAGALSRFLLWESPTVREAVEKYDAFFS